MRSSPVLEVEHLSRAYGSRQAVRDVSFAVRPGQVVGLLGPNGAGKTTTIRVLTGLLPPTSGGFRIAGLPHTDLDHVRRSVGVLPESAGFREWMTGRQVLVWFGRLYGLSRTAAGDRADELLAVVGLADRGGTRVAGYSRGMRQRLGIARALVHRPGLLFLDEPTLGLDPAGQQQVLRLVGALAGQGVAVVLSTHTLPDVEATCDHVLILGAGRVLLAGAVAQVVGAAGAAQEATVRVTRGHGPRAREALARLEGVQVRPGGEPEELTVAVPGGSADSVLPTLYDAGVGIIRFEVAGSRLGDAFRRVTEGADPTADGSAA